MKDKIKIKVGSSLSAILQSTVNIPQAFTELVKNSMQNLATYVKIDFRDDKIYIEDDGCGFDDVEDSSGKNDFDKYFVFGNSYDTSGGDGIRLGHMGIGGKLANDKLSEDGAPSWIIDTKNKNKRAYRIIYNPSPSEFLDDFSPSIEEVDYDSSPVSADTGTLVTIVEVNEKVKKKYPDGKPCIVNHVEGELKTFFGHLVSRLKEENKKFNIYLMGKSLEFDYRLPGEHFCDFKSDFSFDHFGEWKASDVQFKISILSDRSSLSEHQVKGLEVISEVRVCSFSLSDAELIDKIYDEIMHEEDERDKEEDKKAVLFFARKLIGFISCPDLSSVLDKTGMPAKDLSHHGLRDDHPMVPEFYNFVYKQIIKKIREYLDKQKEKQIQKFDNIVSEITKIIFEDENIEDLTSAALLEAEEKKKAKKDAEEKGDEKENNDNDDGEDDSDEGEDGSDQDDELIKYEIIDFGEAYSEEMSKISDYDAFEISINAGNAKFKKIENQKDQILIAAHVAECLITEICHFKNPNCSYKYVEGKISKFYETSFEKMRDRFSV
ncbi:MAG: hypothetical protein CMM25_07895 [Rhodospirillaceae bacterium]|nr:hypothetical protein [Rhodospirillaceae bacterium]